MKVLYDHQIFSWQKFGGISRYFYELITHSSDLFDYEVSGIYSENEYTKKLNIYKNFPIKLCFKGKYRIINCINKINSVKKIKKSDYDIIHPTYYDPYILKYKNKPIVITVYDMIHEIFPEYFNKDKKVVQYKKRMLFNADKIIAISQSTKNDILNIFPMINEEKISVVYLGSSFTVLEINKRKEDYILFTGQRSGYKNFESFIKAIAPLLLEYDLRLVCSGQNFNKREEELLNSLNIKNRVTYKYFSDDELKDSYSKAIAFVFPSLYEGFGIPVLEAFSSGCPAVLSKMSALSEIGGEAAEYFDPYSIEDMRKTIEKVITSPSLREQLSYKGKERIKNYSWEKCVIDTDLVYKSL